MRYIKGLSIVVAAVYVGVSIYLFASGQRDGGFRAADLCEGIVAMCFWLALSLGCIWYGDELGESLTGARFGLVSSSSPGWAVELMGWILLLLPGVVATVRCCQERGR